MKIVTFSRRPAAMQEMPDRTRATTFEVECIGDSQKLKTDFFCDFTINGFLPQMSMRRMRTTAEGSSIRVMAMKLVVTKLSPSETF